MSLTPQWLDELRSRITLSSLIGRSIKVSRAGREYKALCPFHHETTPSFTINDEKGFYHCFGCGAHGDAIRWMTEQRGLGFIDAVKELAGEAGMELPAPDPRTAARAEAARDLRDVTAAAATWFAGNLAGLAGADARAYLARRGVAAAEVAAFGIGFAPDQRSALKSALSEFPVPMLVEAGMLIAVDDKEPYDRFRGRLMIPIRDARGRAIGFGGRILGAGEPKYLNSPDTPLFDKGRVLFNLDRASPASRRTGRVIVVEGYMDVIALAGAGIDDAVAPLGTALTEAQLALLWRMVPVPVLCFDGDNAGQKAAIRAAMRALPLLRPGFSLAFATLPPGQDPDDLVRSGGADALTAVLEAAQPLVERIWAHEVAAAPLATPEARAALKQRVMQAADSIADADVRHHYRAAFQDRLDTLFARPPRPAIAGGSRATGPRAGRYAPPPPRTAHQDTHARGRGGGDGPVIAAILGGLLRYPAVLNRQYDLLCRLSPAAGADAALLNAMIDAAELHESLDTERLLAILADANLYNRATSLLRADAMRFSFNKIAAAGFEGAAEQDLRECIALMVTRPEVGAQLAAATAQLAKQFDEANFAEQQRLVAVERGMTERLLALADRGEI